MAQGKLHAHEKTEFDGATRRSDPAFKLFGRTIPVVPTGDERMERKGKKRTELSVITSATDSCAISSIQDACEDVPHLPDEALHSEDEGDADCDLDELGSSSGSNNGRNEQKSSQGNSTDFEKSGVGALIHVEATAEDNETEEEKHEDSQGLSAQEKMPKKPDKPVPCPRCDSLDTKFCYYNNYNVNQPRHFCKNCQRYWTAGGTLRNVPVGAGRRKIKNSASHQRHVLPDCLSMRSDTPDAAQQLLSCSVAPTGVLNRQLQLPPSASRLHLLPLDMCSLAALDSPSSSTMLSFGQESPLCESMSATSLNLQATGTLQSQGMVSERAFNAMDVDLCSSWETGSPDIKPFYEQELQVQNGISNANDLSLKAEESFDCQHIDESRCGSSVTDQALNQQQVGIGDCRSGTFNCEPPATILGSVNAAPFSVFGGPWQYSYNVGCNSAPAPSSSDMSNGAVADSALSSAQALGHAAANSTWGGLPGNLWSGVPWPFMQSPMWGPAGWGGAWSMPWGSSAAAAAAAAAAATATVNPGLVSPRLRKHPRERSQLEGGTEGSLWIPKTLRIDDPGEAARSSIWTALGLENRPESITSGGIFKAFQPKAESKDSQGSPMQARHTNPAAMTRSMAFQESG